MVLGGFIRKLSKSARCKILFLVTGLEPPLTFDFLMDAHSHAVHHLRKGARSGIRTRVLASKGRDDGPDYTNRAPV